MRHDLDAQTTLKLFVADVRLPNTSTEGCSTALGRQPRNTGPKAAVWARLTTQVLELAKQLTTTDDLLQTTADSQRSGHCCLHIRPGSLLRKYVQLTVTQPSSCQYQ